MIEKIIFLFLCNLVFYCVWVFPTVENERDFFIVVLAIFVSTLFAFFFSIWIF